MNLGVIDYSIIALFFLLTISLGLFLSGSKHKGVKDYFLGNRKLSWGLLGISMVATTFSADTPNLVTDIVRSDGVAGNWVWWAFLLTGMVTVFMYAKLWRRSGIVTDLEFYELRYSGKSAQFLRGFRAIYLGVFFNIMIMATVMLAGIKIAHILLGWTPWQTVLIVGSITMLYSSLGGFKGIIYTDFFQFGLAMIGMIAAAIYIVNMPEIGGLSKLVTSEVVMKKMDLIPDLTDLNIAIPLLIMPLAVQWWSAWYPGSEPGGGGYVAQRMLSARSESHAITATLLFNIAHFALRPWPWIIIALCSLVVFPNLNSMAEIYPNLPESMIKNDLAFPAMLSFLPAGLLGLVIASLLAALMSTISTHLNWGGSYIVNDVYLRFVNKNASEKKQILVGRLAAVVLMLLASFFAMKLENAFKAFNLLLQIGAGTGLLFLLRWFWWRINTYSEITAMVVSFLLALFMEIFVKNSLPNHTKYIMIVLITTIAWVSVTLLTQPEDESHLKKFFLKIRPHGYGWKPIINAINRDSQQSLTTSGSKLSSELLMVFLGCILVYALLFAIGLLLYGKIIGCITAFITVIITAYLLRRLWLLANLSTSED